MFFLSNVRSNVPKQKTLSGKMYTEICKGFTKYLVTLYLEMVEKNSKV